MPTEFDWKTWKKRQNEPPPPPEPEPKAHTIVELMANGLFYVVVLGSLVMAYIMTTDMDNAMRITTICNEQKGVAIRTMRGDAVCIREDVLTNVLNAKNTNRAN